MSLGASPLAGGTATTSSGGEAGSLATSSSGAGRGGAVSVESGGVAGASNAEAGVPNSAGGANDTAGAGGANETAGAAGTNTSVDNPGCNLPRPYRLYYRAGFATATHNSVDFLFKIENLSADTVRLDSLAVRYYFTNELTAPWVTEVYYAGLTSTGAGTLAAHVVVSVTSIPAKPTADSYIEVAFDAGAGQLSPGDSVQVEAAIHRAAYDENETQSNDYSFIASSSGTQKQWDACPGAACSQFDSCVTTIYANGALVWGNPP